VTGTEVAVIYNQSNSGCDEANSLGNVHTGFTKFESTVSQTGQQPNDQQRCVLPIFGKNVVAVNVYGGDECVNDIEKGNDCE